MRMALSQQQIYAYFLSFFNAGMDQVVQVIPVAVEHDDVIKWKHFPRYWPFVREIHRSSVNSPHNDRWTPHTKASDAELWCFLWSADLRLNKRLSKHPWGWWFETPSRPLWRQCNEFRTPISMFNWPDIDIHHCQVWMLWIINCIRRETIRTIQWSINDSYQAQHKQLLIYWDTVTHVGVTGQSKNLLKCPFPFSLPSHY